MYRTRAIITRGLYIFKGFLKVKNIFSRRYFQKILPLFMVRIQLRIMMAHVQYNIEYKMALPTVVVMMMVVMASSPISLALSR
jgi:hypothetical protein